MADLPTGTVTFLFSDGEGPTRLLHELGDTHAASRCPPIVDRGLADGIAAPADAAHADRLELRSAARYRAEHVYADDNRQASVI